MQNVWITGGKGFIGRHLARYVAGLGYRVQGLGHGLWPAREAEKWCYSLWCNGDIEASNFSQLAEAVGEPEIIFHLAGGSSVSSSLQSPREDFRRTVGATSALLEWVRLNRAATRIVAASSAAVYGLSHSSQIPEAAPLAPCSPYGFHKAMMEGLCRSYGASFQLQTSFVRLFSVYGPGLEKQLIWDICCKIAAGGRVRLGGTGQEIRDWIHVSDAVRLLWVSRELRGADDVVLNGGSGLGTAVSDLAATVVRVWGSDIVVEFDGVKRRGDPPKLLADTTRAKRFGFEPRVSLREGLDETIQWFKARMS